MAKKYTYLDVKKIVEDANYKLLSEESEIIDNDIVKVKTKIKVWCKNIKHKPYEVMFFNFKGNKNKKGSRCKECRIEEISIWTEKKIMEYVSSQGYRFNNFINFNKYASRLKVTCPNGHELEVYFSNFYIGKRCRECWKRWDKQSIIGFVESKNYKFKNFIKFDYNNSIIEMECEKGHITTKRFRKLIEGQGCPICNESKGEKRIGDILNLFNIKFERQYKFEDCKCKNCLPFDFYLKELNVVIEFDGIQHYEILPHWGGVDKLIETKIHDTIKTHYCKMNKIKLIRIPYWEIDNIEKIICRELELN